MKVFFALFETYLDFSVTKPSNSCFVSESIKVCLRKVQGIVELDDRVGFLSNGFQVCLGCTGSSLGASLASRGKSRGAADDGCKEKGGLHFDIDIDII